MENLGEFALDPQVTDSRSSAELRIAHEIAPIVENLVGEGRSIIDPSITIWMPEAAVEVRERLVKDPIVGTSMTQWQKLDVQLKGASEEVTLLAAELVFLREHALLNARSSTRSKHINFVLSRLNRDVEIPPIMWEWINRKSGVAGLKAGQAFNREMWRHVSWMAGFVEKFRQQSESERRAILRDPVKLQDFMLNLAVDDRSDIRNIMQFLLFPEAFEAISAQRLKEKIVGELCSRIGGQSGETPQAIDRDLYSIRASIAEEVEGEFGFWTPAVLALWNEEESDEPQRRNYWLYDPGDNPQRWDEFKSEGLIGLGWDGLGDYGAYPDRAAIEAEMQKEDSAKASRNQPQAVWEFQREIQVGDIVFARRGKNKILGRGVVASAPRYEKSRSAFKNVRDVKWEFTGEWEFVLSANQKSLTRITDKRGLIEQLDALFAVETEDELSPVSSVKAYTDKEFLNEVFFTRHQFDRLLSLIGRKKNVILTGPPGVGKTYVARRIAFADMEERDSSRIEQIQFHQSYSYEDFMMGFRPNKDGGFDLVNGPFYAFCEKAREEPDRHFFFIIDEINRGNVSKIFGELLMLIESDKRGQGLRLIYNDEIFSVPDNVYLIGTMNTADRSLAVMDHALRRRFGFFNIPPAFESVGFQTWKESQESESLDALVEVIRALNEVIADDPRLGRGFLIGHSFVVQGSSGDETEDDWLYSVVEDDLVPLLEEYWFDEPALVDSWSSRLREAVE
ncbi:AAA family ATPase [Corynebacterium singulare]|uniref:ATPase family protein associated with various cellular activities (AAA) n=1 Tax=Corynebacterium singulare TaxID=161899 RepID=A0A0B6EZ50_9CORY|nr:AAA family ATPase [Corynebacterium singulare]AJI78219.1 ATPase family protein associated with various cellular activities (AAA) [Corynebacterium singulare]